MQPSSSPEVLAEQLMTGRFHATSPDATVAVVVDGTGQIVTVTVSEHAMQHAPDVLGALVTQTVQEAQGKARDELDFVVSHYPMDTGTAQLNGLVVQLGDGAQQQLQSLSDRFDSLLGPAPGHAGAAR